MSKKIRALHIASFLGNIGDYANHRGFYKNVKDHVTSNIDFSQLEIRKFYKNRAEMKFDDECLKLINSHDLLVLGGGGFVDLNWDYSHTGTTLDMSPEFIQRIKIPVLVNAMGYHEYENTKAEHIKKFESFLSSIVGNKNWLISIRNDGSLERMSVRFPELTKNIMKVPDQGFFYSPKKDSRLSLEGTTTSWLGLNLTNDLFSKQFNKKIDVPAFNAIMSKFINDFLLENTDCKIILFPHTYQDLVTIQVILQGVDDMFRRERIVVAPLVTDEAGIDYVFDLYNACFCVVGMRFHANVCSIASLIPTIGLAGHEQIAALYRELGLSERCITVDDPLFVDALMQQIKDSRAHSDEIKARYAAIHTALKSSSLPYYEAISKWLDA